MGTEGAESARAVGGTGAAGVSGAVKGAVAEASGRGVSGVGAAE